MLARVALGKPRNRVRGYHDPRVSIVCAPVMIQAEQQGADQSELQQGLAEDTSGQWPEERSPPTHCSAGVYQIGEDQPRCCSAAGTVAATANPYWAANNVDQRGVGISRTRR